MGKQAYTPPPDPAPPPPNAPTTANASIQATAAGGGTRAQVGQFGSRAEGLPGTIMTSPQGLMNEANTTRKTLLGQ